MCSKDSRFQSLMTARSMGELWITWVLVALRLKIISVELLKENVEGAAL